MWLSRSFTSEFGGTNNEFFRQYERDRFPVVYSDEGRIGRSFP
jgi:hypothetical protein